MSSKITPDEFARIFTGIRLHFTGKYDYFRYGPRHTDNVGLIRQSNRAIKQFEIDTPREAEMLVSSVLVSSPAKYIVDLIDDPDTSSCYDRIRRNHKTMVNALSKQLGNAMLQAKAEGRRFNSRSILAMLNNRELDPEIYVVLNRIYSTSSLVRGMGANIIEESILERMDKYDKFIVVPSVEFYETVKETCIRLMLQNKPTYQTETN